MLGIPGELGNQRAGGALVHEAKQGKIKQPCRIRLEPQVIVQVRFAILIT